MEFFSMAVRLITDRTEQALKAAKFIFAAQSVEKRAGRGVGYGEKR